MASVDFEQLFRRSPAAYVLFDRELRYVDANDAYYAVTATKPEQLLGRHVFDVFPGDPYDASNPSARQLRDSFERVFATGEVHVIAALAYHVPVEGPNGLELGRRTWSVTNTPIFGKDGKVEMVLHQTEEVTHMRTPSPELGDGTAAAVMRRAQNVQAQYTALEGELNMLRRLLEQAPVFACFLRGHEHVYELANSAYRKLVGHRDVVGQPLREALPELAGQGFYELLDRVFQTGEAFVGRNVPVMLQTTPGSALAQRHLDFTYQPIVERDGSVSGIFVLGSDVTEQFETARSRAHLATIVEQSSDSIAAVDMTGRIQFMNEGGRALVGLGNESLDSFDPRELFPAEERAILDSLITPALLERGHWRGEFRMRNVVTGEPIPVDYNIFLLKGADGELAGAASVTRDLRERRAEEHERLFLTDAIPVQVWIADPVGALTYVNRQVTLYFGTSEQAILRDGWLGYLHADDVQACIQRWTHSLRTGEPYAMEFRLRAPSGLYRWHLARAMPLRDAGGAVSKWYGTNSDIDDQRRGNEERELLIGALAASNRELDRFAYVASHDLKTPLRGIGNLAQWIEDDTGAALSPQSKEHLQLLRGRVERMDALIDGVLKYSRSMKPDEHIQDVDVRDLLDVVIDLLAPPAGVKIVVGEGMPVLRSAYVALQQVFLNFIGNAIKHADRSDVRVEVSVRQDGPFYVFTVSDNGPGIPPEHFERIWGLFQTLKDAQSGSGIGLSVVKRLVELQGGSVEVASAPEKGAAFSFTWPKTARPATPARGIPITLPNG